jgi:hypothetical protein
MSEQAERNAEVETLVDQSASRRVPAPPLSSPSGPSGSRTVATMATTIVMRSEEVERARAFYRLTALMTLVAAGFMPFVPGPTVFRGVVMALCGVAVGGNVVALRRLRDEKRYTTRFVAFMGVLLGVSAELVLFYFGLFTSAVMVLPLGVYFFGLSEKLPARLMFATGSILFGVLSVGVALGLLPDRGPLPVSSLPHAWMWFFIVLPQVVFATTFFLARSSRRATEAAIARVELANRKIFQKDALLAEARSDLDRALRPGEGRYTDHVVDGWTLGELLGRGGMGEVYRAQRGDERAAVKLLHASILADASHVKRFQREAELAAKVESPHVARVIGTGTGPAGVPYVAMELLSGKDLSWHLRQIQRFKLSAVTDLVRHTAKALAAIREAGIVHRDLKPQNVMCEEAHGERVWKVLDFGVSRLEASGNTLTQGALVGTPTYMAPEQAKLQRVDHRADVYSLAAVAYRALTGKPLFAGPDVATVLFHVVHHAPAAPSAFARVPEDVELVLAVGLAKSPDERFQRAEELASAFEDAATGKLDDVTRARGRKLLAQRPWSKPRAGDAT